MSFLANQHCTASLLLCCPLMGSRIPQHWRKTELKVVTHHRRLDRFRHGFLVVWLHDGFLVNSRSELYRTFAEYVAKSDSVDSARWDLWSRFVSICSIHIRSRTIKYVTHKNAMHILYIYTSWWLFSKWTRVTAGTLIWGQIALVSTHWKLFA